MTEPSIWSQAQPARVWENVSAESFRRDIAPLNRPALLRRLAASWPAVAEGKRSPAALSAYLRGFSNEAPIEAFYGAPEIAGRFLYGDDLKSYNFEKRSLTLSALLDQLLAHIDDIHPPGLYAGAVNIPKYLPGLLGAHRNPLLGEDIEQLVSLWIGNRSRTAAHWDLPQNIACVVAGRRRYTLLPIEQIGNLYVGPLDFTLAGRAVSLVDFRNPDLAKHPRFADAVPHAEIADLEPGDAVYVPSLWFHHVESLDPFGAMINFWWRDGPAHLISPQLTLTHALLTLRDLPANERAAWRAVFDHYIFQTDGDPFAHLPDEARGLFGDMTPENLRRIKEFLLRSLSR